MAEARDLLAIETDHLTTILSHVGSLTGHIATALADDDLPPDARKAIGLAVASVGLIVEEVAKTYDDGDYLYDWADDVDDDEEDWQPDDVVCLTDDTELN